MINAYFEPLIKRICQAAQAELRNSDDGVAVITLRVLIGRDNKPVVWAVSDCVKLEPAGRIVGFLEAISGEGR